MHSEDIADDVDDYAIPEKPSITPCPMCKGTRKYDCRMCFGEGFLLASKEHTQWIEED